LSGRLAELAKASQEAMGLSSVQKPLQSLAHDGSNENSNENRVEYDEHLEGVFGDAGFETAGSAIAEGEYEGEDLQHEDLKHENFGTTDQAATEENDNLYLNDHGGDSYGIGNSDKNSDSDPPSEQSEEETLAIVPETRESLTVQDSTTNIAPEGAIAGEFHDLDDLIDYSDDELEPSNETSRSSTIQGDRSNNKGHHYSVDRLDDELPIDFADRSAAESAEAAPDTSTSEGLGFSVPEDIDYFDEDNLSISETYDEETSPATPNGGGYNVSGEQTLTSGDTTADPQDQQGVSQTIVSGDATLATEQPDATDSTHASTDVDGEVNEAAAEESSEQHFDHDDLEWTGLTNGEALGSQSTQYIVQDSEEVMVNTNENGTADNESYVDDFLDLDGLESDAEAPSASGDLTEHGRQAGSPLGKRTWEEHAEHASNDESDQGK
jgi:hypothetical protein